MKLTVKELSWMKLKKHVFHPTNGREGETATLLKESSFTFMLSLAVSHRFISAVMTLSLKLARQRLQRYYRKQLNLKMSLLIRKANSDDVPRLVKLLTDYMQETYHGAWGGNAETIEQHLIEKAVEIFLAETSSREIVGFLAWSSSYDLHWCMKGGVIVDMYVCPQYRNRGAAVLLAIELATEIQKQGGTHLKGGAVESPAVHRLYRRIAMQLGENEYYVSGRAFRRLASLSGKGLREIVKNLPETEWNYEP